MFKVHHYDNFYRRGSYSHYRGFFSFKTREEAEKFVAGYEEAKKKWPRTFSDDEYVIEEVK